MRLFVALMPPETVLDEIDAVFAPHRIAWPGLRWMRRVTWHVTLAFYGEVEDRLVPRLLPRLERAAGRHPSRELCFAGVGAFPRTAAARVLWTGIDGDLRRLADSCLAAARHEGVETGEHHRFHAHLTVARSRDPVDLRPIVAALGAYEGTPWTAGRIHLVRSDLGADIPRYETLEAWPLRGATGPSTDAR